MRTARRTQSLGGDSRLAFGEQLLEADRGRGMNREKFEAYLALARSTVYSEPEEGNFHNALIKQAVDAFIPMFDLPSDAIS